MSVSPGNLGAVPSAAQRFERVTAPPLAAAAARVAALDPVADATTRDAVARIVAAVRAEGDPALVRLTRELDGVSLQPDELEVPRDAWEAARAHLDPAVSAALACAAERVRAFHERQREAGAVALLDDGSRVGTLVRPLARVGLYVPGGQAAYPSSVLMNAIPAAVAGVPEIIAVTPPGGVTDAVLAACMLAGVTCLFRVGGAQAVAALAYGTATIPRVDKIVGPGNRWVAEAKRQLTGAVGIDLIAGPSEVLVIADGSADPALVAADLLAQAEHDRDAVPWLVTTAPELVDAVEAEIERQLVTLPRAAIARDALTAHGVAVVVPDLATAVQVANLKAPEHLELLVADPEPWIERIRHAGAIFIGKESPEPVGDYLAGPSHVLPTGGTARFASPLGVYDFVKRTSVIAYSAERLAADAPHVIALARAEGLEGHARAVERRLAGDAARERAGDD